MKDHLPSASSKLSILIDDHAVACEAGASVASVLLEHGYYSFSGHPIDQSNRGPFCMMGACQACLVFIDGRWRQACQVVVYQGMHVQPGKVDTRFFS